MVADKLYCAKALSRGNRLRLCPKGSGKPDLQSQELRTRNCGHVDLSRPTALEA